MWSFASGRLFPNYPNSCSEENKIRIAWKPTCQKIGHWLCRPKFRFEILWQKDNKTTDNGDLTADAKAGNDVDWVRQQSINDWWKVWGGKTNDLSWPPHNLQQYQLSHGSQHKSFIQPSHLSMKRHTELWKFTPATTFTIFVTDGHWWCKG